MEDLAEVPAVIPARMINEFVYCPRFFHFAFVAKEEGENDLTVEGKWVHRRVDRGGGSLDLGEVRSLDEGHRCTHGEVYFAESKQRVRVEFDAELRQSVHDAMDGLRAVAVQPLPPPPLVDSPKCPACIYVGICLPDEQMLIRRRRSDPPRRLLPADSAAAPLYVSMPGARVGKKGDRIVVTNNEEVLGDERLIDVSQLVVFGNVSVSTVLLRELMGRSIPICYFSSGGWFAGITDGLPSKNVDLRRRQALLSDEVQVDIARRMVEAKILNCRVLLRRNGRPRDDLTLRELKRLAVRAARADAAESLLGYEGAAAAGVFRTVRFDAQGRWLRVRLPRTKPPAAEGSSQRTPVVRLRVAGSRTHRCRARGRAGSVPWSASPSKVRSACARARPRRGVPPTDRRFGGRCAGQQRRARKAGLSSRPEEECRCHRAGGERSSRRTSVDSRPSSPTRCSDTGSTTGGRSRYRHGWLQQRCSASSTSTSGW